MLTGIALRHRSLVAGAATSVPAAAAVLLLLAPFFFDPRHADGTAIAIFAGCGLFFPAAVTLLSYQSNRILGPNLAGALGNVTPVFAVAAAALILNEKVTALQALGIAVLIAGVVLISLRGRLDVRTWHTWALAFPFAGAAIRGVAQPVIKHGLERWPDPFAATTIGYVVSALVLLGVALRRGQPTLFAWDARATPLFVAVGVVNAASVLFMYAGLAHGRVAVVAPLVALYPFFTLLFSALLLHDEPRLRLRSITGIAMTVAGVVIVLLS